MKIMILCLVLALFVIGCGSSSTDVSDGMNTAETESGAVVNNPTSETTTTTTETEMADEPAGFTACTKNAECLDGKYCIDRQCKTFNDVYEMVERCTKYCNYDSVQFTTSDSESYTLKKGEGSYSYAGALEWKVKSLPDYCQGQAPKVALLLVKKNAGKILEDTYITMQIGDTSPIITHPTITRVQFTARVDYLQEACT